MKWSFAIVVFIGLGAAYASDLAREEQQFAKQVSKACDVKVEFDLHDYAYGDDESSLYGNRHFQDCSLLKHLLSLACEKHPKNKAPLLKVKKIFCQRGNKGQGKLLQRKNGDLVYLIDSHPEREKFLEENLTKVLGLDFKANYQKEQEAKVKEKEKAAEDQREAERQKRSDDLKKKIDELTAWFQQEVQKITKTPGPDMSQRLEKLSKTYEEKLNALRSSP